MGQYERSYRGMQGRVTREHGNDLSHIFTLPTTRVRQRVGMHAWKDALGRNEREVLVVELWWHRNGNLGTVSN